MTNDSANTGSTATEYVLPAQLHAVFTSAALQAAASVLNEQALADKAAQANEALEKQQKDMLAQAAQPFVALAEKLKTLGPDRDGAKFCYDFSSWPGSVQVKISLHDPSRSETGVNRPLLQNRDGSSGLPWDGRMASKFANPDGSEFNCEKTLEVRIKPDPERPAGYSIRIECRNILEEKKIRSRPNWAYFEGDKAYEPLKMDNVSMEEAMDIIGRSVGLMAPDLFAEAAHPSGSAATLEHTHQ